MSDTTPKRDEAETATGGLARRVPSQRRSRERFERILESAMEIISEKGSDAFRMSDIVERTGIPFGSLYQYFPDKTAIIGTLAERYNAEGRACVEQELASVDTLPKLHAALCRIVEGYYRMFLDEPILCDIWHATQTDKELQRADEAEMRRLAQLLLARMKGLAPSADETELTRTAELVMVLIAATVRHAITLERPEGERVVEQFKAMLSRSLPEMPG
ncbi:TetR/AcrR family transcriptional regulator [Fodinicurvata fenggangensis]|uniref:TetR/AcrR family transcriptional regulator n=1 Tax=Fodinicurvata fenggangensis TaxID=1121830 RepID=UPI00055393B6|nr:TetR/AcrR family transcriptional regulator [Fodinicurvata fenggangensis]